MRNHATRWAAQSGGAVFLLALLLSCCARAEDDKIARLAVLCEQWRADGIKDYERESAYVRKLIEMGKKRGKLDPQVTAPVIEDRIIRYPSRESRVAHLAGQQERLNHLQGELKRIKDDDAVTLPFFKPDLKVGDMGVCADTITVDQIVDDENMLVSGNIGVERENDPGTVDSQDWRTKNQSVWISGVSTKGLVDGQQLKLEDPLEVAGTKRYETTTGAQRTTFLLKALNTTGLKAVVIDLRRPK